MPAIAAGTYTDIVEIIAPDSASPGEIVSVTVRIKNTWTDYVHIAAVGVRDSEERFIDWLDQWVPSGQTYSFSGSFTMPNEDITIHLYSLYEDIEGYWRFDDEEEKVITLEAGWQFLSSKIVTIMPIGWQMIGEKTITITPVAWEKLAEKTITITPIVAWQKLATKTVTLTPSPANWQKLAEKTVTITPGVAPPPPPPPEEKKFPWEWVAVGGAGLLALVLLAKPKKE